MLNREMEQLQGPVWGFLFLAKSKMCPSPHVRGLWQVDD